MKEHNWQFVGSYRAGEPVLIAVCANRDCGVMKYKTAVRSEGNIDLSGECPQVVERQPPRIG